MTEKDPTEIVAAWMIKNGFATGHGDTLKALLSELEWQIAEMHYRLKNAEDDLKNLHREMLTMRTY